MQKMANKEEKGLLAVFMDYGTCYYLKKKYNFKIETL